MQGVRAWQRGGTLGLVLWDTHTDSDSRTCGIGWAGIRPNADGYSKKRTCRMSVAAVTVTQRQECQQQKLRPVSCGQERANHKPRVRERGTSGVPGSGVEVSRTSTGPRSQNSKCGVCVSVGGHVRETLISRRIGAGAWRSAPTRRLVRDGIARLVAYD